MGFEMSKRVLRVIATVGYSFKPALVSSLTFKDYTHICKNVRQIFRPDAFIGGRSYGVSC